MLSGFRFDENAESTHTLTAKSQAEASFIPGFTTVSTTCRRGLSNTKQNSGLKGLNVNSKKLAVPADRPLSDKEWQAQQAAVREEALQQVGAVLAVLQPTFVSLLNQVQEQIYTAMQINGFWNGEQDNLPSKVALVHSELSELLEANRKAVTNDDKVPEFTGEEAEAADTIIRLLDMAGRYQWRLAEAIVAKMLFNLSRPYKHGKQY